ncbi:MAG: hypothetical protein V3U71_06420 [Cocleimonas sp.]
MQNTIPNKETIRRICILNGATNCYLLASTEYTYTMVLMDIAEEKTNAVKIELKSWCGMEIRVFTYERETEGKKEILAKGEKILPINI